MSELIGQEVAGFRILREIARGGMGVVFEAEQVRLGRPVALKMLYPTLTVDGDFLVRFKREAKTLARLNHENIVSVLDFFEHQERHFLAMEFVEGETLARRLRRCARHQRFFSLGAASQIAWQVAQALAFAHSRHIVHRDLKPDNVMLTPRGRAKVMDFGIAKIVGSDSGTEVGTRVGTPDYMAPEQLHGHPADERSDLFALGLIYYEMMAGRRPFSQADLLRAEHGAAPDLPWDESLMPPGSVRARPVLERLLVLDPQQRCRSAADVLDEMRERLGGEVLGDEAWATPPRVPTPEEAEAVEAEPARGARSRRWLWPLVAACLVVGLATGIYVSHRVQKARLDKFEEQDRKREARMESFEALFAVREGRYTEAHTHFLRATVLDPENALYQRNLGDFLYDRGRLRDAMYYYERTLELDPSDQETAARLREIRKQLGVDTPSETPP